MPERATFPNGRSAVWCSPSTRWLRRSGTESSNQCSFVFSKGQYIDRWSVFILW